MLPVNKAEHPTKESPMRRQELEVKDPGKIDEIIAACEVLRIGLRDGERIYIVPMSFGYDRQAKCFYCHCAAEGRKLNLIQQSGYAAFELDCGNEIRTAETACGFSSSYRSIIGEGDICVVQDMNEKQHAMVLLMQQYSGRGDWEIPETAFARFAVIRLSIRSISAKAHD